MKKRIISIAGDLASGKSRVTDLLQKDLGYSIYRNGEKFRALGLSMGMNVSEFSVYAENHPEVDRKLEEDTAEYAKDHSDFIIDARMAWYSIPESFKVYLKVDSDEGARRAFNDPYRKKSEDFASVEEYKEFMKARYDSENERYFKLYGVRRDDMNNYDLVIDTTNIAIEEVKEKILNGYKEWLGEA